MDKNTFTSFYINNILLIILEDEINAHLKNVEESKCN